MIHTRPARRARSDIMRSVLTVSVGCDCDADVSGRSAEPRNSETKGSGECSRGGLGSYRVSTTTTTFVNGKRPPVTHTPHTSGRLSGTPRASSASETDRLSMIAGRGCRRSAAGSRRRSCVDHSESTTGGWLNQFQPYAAVPVVPTTRGPSGPRAVGRTDRRSSTAGARPATSCHRARARRRPPASTRTR